MRFRSFLLWVVILTVLCVAAYAGRYRILRASADFLMEEDSLRHAPVLFVFSGKPYERGLEAARLLKAQWADRAICTGEIVPQDLKAAQPGLAENALTRRIILSAAGVDSSRVQLASKGTSTYEECVYILDYCRAQHVKNAMLVSSKLHTRRIASVMKKLRTERDSVHFIIRGAPSTDFNENEWWRNEAGLIFVNNEYVKLLYYALKY